MIGPLTNLDDVKGRLLCPGLSLTLLSLFSRVTPHTIVSPASLPNVQYPYKDEFLVKDPLLVRIGASRKESWEETMNRWMFGMRAARQEEGPSLPYLGIRACVANAILTGVDRILDDAGMVTEDICQSVLYVHNRHDTTCDIEGTKKLYEKVKHIRDRKLIIVNAKSEPAGRMEGSEGEQASPQTKSASGWHQEEQQVDDQGKEGGEQRWWDSHSEEVLEGLDVHHSMVSDPHGFVVFDAIKQWIQKRLPTENIS
eukprot:GHVS01083509.1.p1 GENE.GHVS01083509.1~~GHVS01083509.1.p1  ORF type:complete len:255 (-),score=38.67 GHVS01083509.1:62-826(-)